jgi:C-terminal processing protease CtpA/Prc
MRAPTLLASLLLCLSTATVWAGEPGYFGFAPEATTSGFVLSPKVERITILRVLPGTPAARAGILPGDEVLKVEGMVVHGAKALTLHGMIEKDVGQILHATLRHAGGAVYDVAMVAAPRPK